MNEQMALKAHEKPKAVVRHGRGRQNRHESDCPAAVEFRLITPKEVKRLRAGLVMYLSGIVFCAALYSVPGREARIVLMLLFLAVAPLGMMLVILFGAMVICERHDIARFRPIERIVVSSRGIVLCSREANSDSLIEWRQIKRIRVRHLNRMFRGLIEPGQEPAAVDLDFLDGTALKIPIFMILRREDRPRFVFTLRRYLSAYKVA